MFAMVSSAHFPVCFVVEFLCIWAALIVVVLGPLLYGIHCNSRDLREQRALVEARIERNSRHEKNPATLVSGI